MATVHRRLLGLSGEPVSSLRLGCDPLHHHLLRVEASVLTAWHPIKSWCGLLRQAAVDAALISMAGMAAPPQAGATGSRAVGNSAGEVWLNSVQYGPDITALPLGRRPLVLIHAKEPHAALDRDRNPKTRQPWQLLLPPAEHQPRLWRQLKRLALLPLRDCSATDSESWLQELLQGPQLLPAHLSMLEEAPCWRDAGLRAVPPPEPLEEQLWLLVRQGEEQHPAIEALAAQLREHVLRPESG